MSTKMSRGGQVQLHQRDQALASGQHLGIGAVLVKQGNRFVQRFRGGVLKLRWYHEALLYHAGGA